MIYLYMKTKKVFFLIIILVAIDQLIKLIINKFYLDSEFEIIPSLLYFKPTFNHKYFYINSLFNLVDGFWVHIIGCIAVILIMLIIDSYLKRKKYGSFILRIGIMITIAGAISALICTIFWNGTLDYIYLKPLFVFDLKDLYLNSIVPCLIINIIIQHKNQKRLSN